MFRCLYVGTGIACRLPESDVSTVGLMPPEYSRVNIEQHDDVIDVRGEALDQKWYHHPLLFYVELTNELRNVGVSPFRESTQVANDADGAGEPENGVHTCLRLVSVTSTSLYPDPSVHDPQQWSCQWNRQTKRRYVVAHDGCTDVIVRSSRIRLTSPRTAVSTWARQFTRASISLPQARYEPLRRAFGRWQNADCGPRSPKIYVCRRGRCSSRLRRTS